MHELPADLLRADVMVIGFQREVTAVLVYVPALALVGFRPHLWQVGGPYMERPTILLTSVLVDFVAFGVHINLVPVVAVGAATDVAAVKPFTARNELEDVAVEFATAESAEVLHC